MNIRFLLGIPHLLLYQVFDDKLQEKEDNRPELLDGMADSYINREIRRDVKTIAGKNDCNRKCINKRKINCNN